MPILYTQHFRSHPIFDGLVWLGLRISKQVPIWNAKNIDEYDSHTLMIHIGEFMIDLPFNVVKIRSLIETNGGTTIIFDANLMSYKVIIEQMMSPE